jgi:hypothetical protein
MKYEIQRHHSSDQSISLIDTTSSKNAARFTLKCLAKEEAAEKRQYWNNVVVQWNFDASMATIVYGHATKACITYAIITTEGK